MAKHFDDDRIDEEQLKEEDEDDDAADKDKKVFINHVDSFQGKNIARFFARVKPGAAANSTEDEEISSQKLIEINDEPYKDDAWKVSGTVQNQQGYTKPGFIQEIVQSKDREQLLDYLVDMNVIIYDITQDPGQVDEAVWICQTLESVIKQIDHQIKFILLSTVMTWTKTQPNEDDVPFSEDEHRRRRAHPRFKEHYNAEKTVTKIGLTNKKKLFTYVVATGFTYGMGENIFHYLFKLAWFNTLELPVFGKSKNFLPTIHMLDLAVVLQNLADRQFKTRYIVANDTSKDTLIRITRKVSQALGYGRIRVVEQEEAMLNKDITQTNYEMLFVNMRFEPMFIKDRLGIKWHCENGLIKNIQKIVDEFRVQRNLTPIKIYIFGPPASGKTTIAKQLAQEYKLHHLQLKEVLDETKHELEQLIKRYNDQEQNDDGTMDDEKDESLGERVEEAKNILEKLDEFRRDPKYARLDDEILTQIFKLKLMSPPCQNQGYILDGYPKTYDQAQSLFGVPNEGEEENAEEKKPLANERIIPEYVYILEANNTYLRQRIMYLPEKLVAGTHNTELEFKRRLKLYNDLGDDYHPAKFFEDLDRSCETIKIDDDRSINHRSIVEKIMERVKKPHNYGLTAEEEEIAKQKELFEKEKREREEREEREREEQEAENDRMKKAKEWTTKLDQVKREQHDILDTQSLPLRNYLMRHVMPTLTKALIECCRVQPEDPVDFVAEYLFKNNPQM